MTLDEEKIKRVKDVFEECYSQEKLAKDRTRAASDLRKTLAKQLNVKNGAVTTAYRTWRAMLEKPQEMQEADTIYESIL